MLNLSSEILNNNVLLLCASLGLAIFADWAAQKWQPVCLWLGIVAVLLFFFGVIWMGNWLLIGIMLLSLLLEALWNRRWYNWASKQTLESLGINSCSTLMVIAVQGLAFGSLIKDFPSGTGSWGLAVMGVPLWLQVLVLVVVLDFKKYCFHRLDHSSIFFWRFHKVHHAISQLHYLAARDHPSYAVGHTMSSIGIAYLIGGTPEALVLSLLIDKIFSGIIAHLNLDFPSMDKKFPWFAYLIVTPNFHAWHHTVHCRYNANLADVFPLWDILFGTFEMPQGSPSDWQFGLKEEEQLPPSVLGQLISPFSNI